MRPFWAGIWLGLLCAFGANALAWSAAGSMGGVAGFAKDIFPLPGNKKTARRKAMARRAVFSAQTPAFSPLDLLFSRLPPAFCKKQKQTRRKSAEVFDFTMADRLLGKRHEISLLILKKTNFTFSPFSNAHRFSFAVFENPNKIHVFSRR